MKRGDRVAEFELPDQTGAVRSVTSLLADGPIVLFFYPAAMTPGCTKEACHFRDLAGEFAAVGASRCRYQHRSRRQAGQVLRHSAFRLSAAVRRRRQGRHAVRRQAWAAGQADAGQADDVRHRHRPDRARRDLQRVQHGYARRQGAGGAPAAAERLVLGVDFCTRVVAAPESQPSRGIRCCALVVATSVQQ